MIRWNTPLVAICLLFAVCFAPFSLFAQDAKDLNRRGVTDLRSGNYKEAAESLQKAMKLEPNWAEPYFNYYQVLKAAKKGQESMKFLKKAYDLEPKNPQYRDEVTKLLKEDLTAAQKEKNSAKVADLREQILRVNPGEVEVALAIVVKHFEAGQFDQVKSIVKDLLSKNQAELPKYSSAAIGDLYYYLAKVEYDDKELKAALEHADKAIRYPLEKSSEAKELIATVKKAYKDIVNGYIAAGKSFMAKGQNEKALDEFNKGLALDPENEQILTAIEQMDNRKQVNDLIAQANKLVAEERWLQARDQLERVVRIQPKNQDAKNNLKKAMAYEEEILKKLGKAEKLPRGIGELSSMAEGYINMGQRYLEVKNFKEAQVAFQRAQVVVGLDSKLDGLKAAVESGLEKISSVDNSKQLWEKGKELYKNQEYEDCLKTLSQLPQDYTVDILSFMAYCYWKTGDKEKAKECAHRQLERQSDNNRSRYVLASIFHEGGDNSTANKLALEIQKSDPEYPGIDDLVYKTGALRWGPLVIPILVIGILLYIAYIIYGNLPEYYKNAAINRGKAFLAKSMFKECIETMIDVKKMPNISQYDGAVISRVLAQCFLKCATYDKAIGECKHLLSINPADPEAHSWLGFAYLGRRIVSPESLPELLSLYKAEKKNIALVSLLGQHYTAQKNLSAEGVEILERWHELEPTNPDVLKSLGKLYLQKGRSDATAMKVFESMMTTSKPEPEFMLGVAKIHMKALQYESCLKICETVLTLDVNNELVHPLLRECYRKMDKLPDLIEIYRAFLAENPYNVAFQKGLMDAQKLANTAAANAPIQIPVAAPIDAPPVAQLGENEVFCPHCNKVNLNTDYYCQHCGQVIQQG